MERLPFYHESRDTIKACGLDSELFEGEGVALSDHLDRIDESPVSLRIVSLILTNKAILEGYALHALLLTWVVDEVPTMSKAVEAVEDRIVTMMGRMGPGPVKTALSRAISSLTAHRAAVELVGVLTNTDNQMAH